MVSRRNFFAIFLMMFVVFFLCLFSQVMRNHLYQSNNDLYDSLQMPAVSEVWSQDNASKVKLPAEEELGVSADRNIIFVGNPDSEVAETVKQWCRLHKSALSFYEILPLSSNMDHSLDYLILIDAESISTGCYMMNISGYLRRGSTIVFLTLPPTQVIQENDRLKNLLGITRIMSDEVTVDGIRIFDGALIGGEAVYKAGNAEDRKYQDLDLKMPWYITAEGSKTYMVGMLDENKYDRESFPRIVWRYSGGNTKVFAVNGDYLKDLTGFGILDLCLYESADFTLYPVVNSQTSLFIDMPGMSDEQSDVMRELYFRDSNGAQRDIFFPGIISVVERNELVPTFMLRTKYDLDGDAELDTEHLGFYLEEIRGLSGEAGRSLRYTGSGSDLEDKLAFDSAFYDNPGVDYRFRAAFTDDMAEVSDMLGSSDKDLFGGIATIAGADDTDELFYYLNDDMTFQSITQDATTYSYSRDLLARSLNSSVGYSALKISLNNAFQPSSENEQWENYFDRVSSYISTYWSRFCVYEQTTLSESDYRIRKMLSLDYETFYKKGTDNNKITLFAGNTYGDCWFLLRTHDQKIDSMTGGDWELLEKDAYLIHITGERAEIDLKDSDEVYSYKSPF